MTVSAMSGFSELKFIKLVEREFGKGAGKGVLLGIGDDCASVSPSPGHETLLTTDTLCEGVHFKSGWTTPRQLGHKSVCVSLSDIAAMGGRPRSLLLSAILTGREGDAWIKAYVRGVAEAAKKWGAAPVGGNVALGKSRSFTVSAVGEVRKGLRVDRGGAKPGDHLFVTGSPGDSALGLGLLKERRDVYTAAEKKLMARHNAPTPRVEWGPALAEARIASAMIDISDGVALDLARLAQASGVAAEVDLAEFPLSAAAKGIVDQKGERAWRTVLTGGEDYELMFTVPEKKLKALSRLQENGKIRAARIGRMLKGKPGVTILDLSGGELEIGNPGWLHDKQ